MPFGKKIRNPKSESNSPGVVFLRTLFNSCAKGFNMIKYIIAIKYVRQLDMHKNCINIQFSGYKMDKNNINSTLTGFEDTEFNGQGGNGESIQDSVIFENCRKTACWAGTGN